jgi:hypothetical protein
MEREPETIVLGVGDSERCDAGGDSKKLMATNGAGELEVTVKAVWFGTAALVVWLAWTRLLSVISI